MLEEINAKVAEAKRQAAEEAKAKAVKEAQAAAPAVVQHAAPPMVPESSGWGAIEDIDAGDLLVPKIYHQQAISKFVEAGNARPGDFCDSFTGNVLAAKDSKLEVIVFGSFKTMVISRLDPRTQKFLLDRIVQITPQNAAEFARKPFVEEFNGESFKNSLTYNFYCLVPSLINELPFVLSLSGTKTKVAKKLNTMLVKLNQQSKPGASVVFELRSIQEKNDSGSWFGIEVTQGRNSTPEELKIAYNWYLKSRTTKIVAGDDHAEHATSDDSDIPF
jgi:hypothetical protein